MAYYSGVNGQLWIDGTRAGQVRNWSLNATASVLDTTSLADTDSTSIYGLRNTAGACTLFYHQDSPGSGGSCSELIRNLIQARTAGSVAGVAPPPSMVTLRLKIEDGSTNGRYVEGECLLTSASMSMAQGEALAAVVSFQFNGAPTEVVL